MCWALKVFLLLPMQEPLLFYLKSKSTKMHQVDILTVYTWNSRPRNVDSSNSLHVFHQNVRGLRRKSVVLINLFDIGNTNPHILFFSEHHMIEQDLLLHITLPDEMLGCSFCCQNTQVGGVCIFIGRDLYFNRIHIITI